MNLINLSRRRQDCCGNR